METYENSMFGGNGLWIFGLLVLLLIGNGGGLFGNNNAGFNQYATAASQQEILFGQQFQGLDNKIDRIGNGIADATFALNNSVTGEGRGIQMQLAECCCNNQKNVDSLRFDMSNYAAATEKAIHCEGEATRALLQQNKIEALQAQISSLQLKQELCGVIRYPQAVNYSAGYLPWYAPAPAPTATA